MNYMITKRIIGVVVTFAIFVVGSAASPFVRGGETIALPTLPSPLCDEVGVSEGNEVFFHVYARGLQIYRWDGTAWVVTPSATLYADAGFNAQVGTHYAGPTWESNSGSFVKATRMAGCAPDVTAIPWLKLQATSTSGPGVFSAVTYVQGVNTTGGLAPTTPGSYINESVEVPYTAEYYFYRGN